MGLLDKIQQCVDRTLYSPIGRRISFSSSSTHSPVSLDLIHSDVLTPGFSALFKEKFPSDYNQILESADGVCELVFDFLGKEKFDLKKFRDRSDLHYIPKNPGQTLTPARAEGRVPWHFDFHSSVGWNPMTFFGDINPSGYPGLNIKIPLELSGCQHFLTLGQSYQLTHDEKYARSFFNQCEDWINQNPPKYGVNWFSTANVATRACHWLLAWDLFKHSPSKPDWFGNVFHKALLDHGQHLWRYIGPRDNDSHHQYLAGPLGLHYIGRALAKKNWVHVSKKKLEPEIQRQTVFDGTDKGESPPAVLFKKAGFKIENEENPSEWVWLFGF